MKTKGRIRKFVLCMAAVLAVFSACCFSVSADDTSLTVGMDQYRTDGGKILIYANHNQGSGFSPDMAESSVMVGKQSLAIEKIEKFKDVDEPVSYMFVVDISGSMDKKRIDIIKDTLREFIRTRQAGDNFCIATMGDDLTSSGFLEDTQALNDFVDAIEVTRQDTDLYKSIKEELNVLKTDKSVHQKRCLIIFSDGADDQADGITQSEAETQVQNMHIPVFTVALLPDSYKDSDLESAKILGSFARYSAGGVHYVPQIDGFDCIEVCAKITEVIESSLIVTADLADVTAADGNIYLGVELVDGSARGRDGMEIPVGDILDAIKEAQSVQVNVNINKGNTEEPATEEETTTEVPEEEGSSNRMVIVVIALIAVAVIVVIVIILVTQGKKGQQPAPSGSGSVSQGSGSRTVGLNQSAPVPEPAPEPKKEPNPNAVKVVLYKVGPGESEKHTLLLDDKKSIGRKKACDLCLADDDALSGVHCYLFSKNKSIYVQDNKSTNGTYINGVPITGEFRVESGDILLIGSAEYRIMQE